MKKSHLFGDCYKDDPAPFQDNIIENLGFQKKARHFRQLKNIFRKTGLLKIIPVLKRCGAVGSSFVN
ncbi:hypothetical protein COY65_00105 [Candidatus Jorgensenbacteria bacterium CG_4_10_14_0_8_um_filter_39_13]|uniref:Uncharacterized protein n=2 Tax=Candidatus Joergenseniibacteriota TaxID=1752739 RepID=A0A2M7RIM1_9BACT|nr:MAG: hypothetical protein COV54_02420 [Candidatus Jorgensenbacteria bacterium CG11_big_fil_rev_8_21_14_0_20_38_23]PIV13164.1 MAG: hypothetical protein COS46_01730 [Candidatus Jorgensenbacteria bacterium CG03_land_8_20_14_0_80_38_39]PIY96613.1 MAG: hypothetical protein COY65_00105 [Candidatus Jorgensenbacteria bacterium CG_4_10_14_0_8_um_filter_39_13]